ncbi:MAG: ATP-binding protein [Polaribacter sp.]
MFFEKVIGQEHIKNHLITSVESGRIPHAQLFVGDEGTGTLPMAIAYAQHILHYYSNDKEATAAKCQKLQHPDLHFGFPVTSTDSVKKHPVSNLFLEEWRSFMEEQPYGSLFNWLKHIGVDNKQGIIGVDEAEDIVKKLLLKSYEGGSKIMILWMVEKMNIAAANKLLKLIEEPPEKTIFLLVTENEEQLLDTIKSRCQVFHFPKLPEEDIANHLVKQLQIEASEAKFYAYQSDGNFNKALHLALHDSKDSDFEEWFVFWVRTAFRAKGNPTVVQDLISWSETIAKSGRETQKQFLLYCIQFFRQALLQNYTADDLVFFSTSNNFDLKKFAPYVNSANIVEIFKELDTAIYHIERNGNAKVILLDLTLKLTRFLHRKESAI